MTEIEVTYSYETAYTELVKSITKTIYWDVPYKRWTWDCIISKINNSEQNDEPPQIHLKIKRCYDNLELYYLSLTTGRIKGRAWVKIIKIGSEGIIYNYEECNVFDSARKFDLIEPNEWIHFASLSACQCSANGYVHLSLKFIFDVLIDEEKSGNLWNLSKGYENIFKSGLYSDVTIKSNDGKEFKAHKAVLASRSDVFKAHFEHNTKECHTNVLESPLDAAVLQEVLLFIYSAKTTMVNKIPGEMLVAADYYQLPSLKTLCEEALSKTLTVTNAIDIHQLADRHSADRLKMWTLDVIKKNKEEFVKTEAWAELKSVELIKTIFEFISK